MTRAAQRVAAFGRSVGFTGFVGLVATVVAFAGTPAAANDDPVAQEPVAEDPVELDGVLATSDDPEASETGPPAVVDPHAERERRIRELVKEIRRDQETLTAIISQHPAVAQADPSNPDAAPSDERVPPLPLREDVRALAARLPLLQQELRDLRGEWALLESPAIWR